MDYMLFTVEEENLICAFDTSNRAALIDGINAAMPDFDEPDLLDIAQNTLRKLNGLSDAEYETLTFTPAYDSDENGAEG